MGAGLTTATCHKAATVRAVVVYETRPYAGAFRHAAHVATRKGCKAAANVAGVVVVIVSAPRAICDWHSSDPLRQRLWSAGAPTHDTVLDALALWFTRFYHTDAERHEFGIADPTPIRDLVVQGATGTASAVRKAARIGYWTLALVPAAVYYAGLRGRRVFRNRLAPRIKDGVDAAHRTLFYTVPQACNTVGIREPSLETATAAAGGERRLITCDGGVGAAEDLERAYALYHWLCTLGRQTQ